MTGARARPSFSGGRIRPRIKYPNEGGTYFMSNRDLSVWNLFDDFWTPTAARRAESWNPAAEVEEAEDHYLLTLEMPGVPEDQIKLEVVDQQLTISGERRAKEEHKNDGTYYTERRFGSFMRPPRRRRRRPDRSELRARTSADLRPEGRDREAPPDQDRHGRKVPRRHENRLLRPTDRRHLEESRRREGRINHPLPAFV